ncbi:unnamed protein product [Prorocentrum cordatum]|uniref:Uncharacterized protein n=1 Tax=Prorocentrum cordatum TaxID=2364126 RepID=A0ABN9W419_9DINO|nr:unnamed protein product [Polarella glacialis]
MQYAACSMQEEEEEEEEVEKHLSQSRREAVTGRCLSAMRPLGGAARRPAKLRASEVWPWARRDILAASIGWCRSAVRARTTRLVRGNAVAVCIKLSSSQPPGVDLINYSHRNGSSGQSDRSRSHTP